MEKSGQQDSGFVSMKFPRTKSIASKEANVGSDSQWFEAQFNQNWPAIYRHLVNMVGDPSEAQDLALETFLRLYRQAPSLDKNNNLSGWLYKVATNLGLQSIRSYKRRVNYELAAGKNALEEIPSDQPARILAEEEERRLARAALARMNPRRSQLLVLRYSGLSYREIADTLNLSPTSIGPLLLRAEHEFEKCYRKINQEES